MKCDHMQRRNATKSWKPQYTTKQLINEQKFEVYIANENFPKFSSCPVIVACSTTSSFTGNKVTVLQSAHLISSFSRTVKLKASLILPLLRNLKGKIHPSLEQITEKSALILGFLNNNVQFSVILMQHTFCTTQVGAFGQDCSSS